MTNASNIMGSSPLTISVPEAGRKLGLSRNSSYEAAKRGEIPTLRFGNKIRVPLIALERLLAGESKQPERKIA